MEIKYGQRCLPRVLDEISVKEPSRLYAVIPRSTELVHGFRDISFSQMSHCVDHFAHKLEKEIGRSDDSETVAYLGVPDLRNVVVFLAAVKCGYKLLYLSPRNPSSTNILLLQATQCTRILFSTEMRTLVIDMQVNMQTLKSMAVISLEVMLQEESEPYPYQEVFAEVVRKPILILHSSGSTGIPKPIIMTHGTFATKDFCRHLPTIPGRRNNDFTLWDSKAGRKFYSPFPPSHLAGFLSMVVVPIFSEASSPVLGPPLRPPSGDLVKTIMELQDLRGLFVPPAIAEQILIESGGLELLQKLDFMYTAGGPLSQSAGDRICQVTTLCQLYGSTETSQIPQLIPLAEDWAYMEWHPIVKHEMRLINSVDGVCELVLYMDSSTEKISALNHNIPNAQEWPTRDLFMPHPSKPGLWRFHGRTDDIIVLSNSEKFFPVPMEIMISGHSLVSGALVIGQGRFQAALLIEPKADTSDKAAFVEQIWPLVEKANLLVPGQGRIVRSKIFIASSNNPFRRAPKGTIVRKLTEQAYEEEINDLYSLDATETKFESLPTLKGKFELPEIETFVRSVVSLAFSRIDKASNDDDMFVLGLDSLKTIEIVGLLIAAVRNFKEPLDLQWLSARTIYSNPTIKQLAVALAEFRDAGLADIKDFNCNESREQHTAKINLLIHKYTQDLTQCSVMPRPKLDIHEITVAVTGASGSLGSHLVQTLSHHPQISRIYCLDRREITHESHDKQGMKFKSSKILYRVVKIGQSCLGLEQSAYDELVNEVDVIVHNAWKVDFNHILDSFENDHIRGVRSLIDWSIASEKNPRIVFVSSVSSVSNWKDSGTDSFVPELLVSDPTASAHMGYGESKLVAELILGRASQDCGVPVSIMRIGQVAGSTDGSDPPWPIQEWMPALVKTSKSLGLVPNNLPPIDWIPIDQLANVMVELIQHDVDAVEMLVYNLVNPHCSPWDSVLEVIIQYCGPQTQSVPLATWLEKLKLFKDDQKEVVIKPALKMLRYFTQMSNEPTATRYQTSSGAASSPSMANMEPVNGKLMSLWLDQWRF